MFYAQSMSEASNAVRGSVSCGIGPLRSAVGRAIVSLVGRGVTRGEGEARRRPKRRFNERDEMVQDAEEVEIRKRWCCRLPVHFSVLLSLCWPRERPKK